MTDMAENSYMKKNKKAYLILLSTVCFMFSIAGSRSLIPKKPLLL